MFLKLVSVFRASTVILAGYGPVLNDEVRSEKWL